MSKLPNEFVQTTKPKFRASRSRKATIVAPDPREVLLALTDEELEALEAARHSLHHTGTPITIDQMIHRVLAEWLLRRNAKPAEPAPPAPPAPTREQHIVARLREVAAAPLQTWHDITATVRHLIRLRRARH